MGDAKPEAAAPAASAAGSGAIDPTSPLGMTAGVHPDYKHTRMVPEWAVPGHVQLAASVVSVFAGALLGAGLAPLVLSTPKIAPSAVQGLAQQCVKDLGACDGLTLVSSSTGAMVGALIAGLVLVVVHVVLVATPWWSKRKGQGSGGAS